MANKVCSKCLIEKSTEEFYKHPEAKDGFQGCCKECKKAYQRSEIKYDKYEPDAVKKCRICNIEKKASEFKKQWSGKYGVGTLCKNCVREKRKKAPYPSAPPGINGKICSKCNEYKKLSEFSPAKDCKYGVITKCKSCCALERKERYAKDPEKYRKISRDRTADPVLGEKIRESKREYYHNTLKLDSEKMDKRRESDREYAKSDKNKKRRKAYSKEYFKDPNNRLRHNISALIGNKLKQFVKDGKGGKSVFDMLDYSLADYVGNLKRKFSSSMSLENYGEWTVDHIVAQTAFDLANPDEFELCWSLENIHPMWKRDNNSKNNKLLSKYLNDNPDKYELYGKSLESEKSVLDKLSSLR